MGGISGWSLAIEVGRKEGSGSDYRLDFYQRNNAIRKIQARQNKQNGRTDGIKSTIEPTD